MKFEKILKSLIEQTLPSWRDKFLCYKILKKQLKLMCSEDGQIDPNQLNRFLNLLQQEIDKFNTFFIEKEEEYVIKGKELQDRVMEALDLNVDLIAGLVKIIKKHDKKTGALLRVPFIQDVVKQPFYEIDVINKLVKDCEVLSILFTNGLGSPMGQNFMENGFGSVSINENEETVMHVPEELSDLKTMKNMYIELTLSALHTLEQIRGRGSTQNMFSSPSPHN
ncbi:SPX domain-containing protein [Vigna angularis]|uniref:SPX domain-containing protein n=2 Tax=Phaseolus angularis TaxID=3914 RepID=A0A8T0KQB3_PHAAN|nr:SPX domain-containing protein [Vigna angularis]BAT93903.1 hypothetical protein VIGAN_08045400 [Vigna angularis var. angularis]